MCVLCLWLQEHVKQPTESVALVFEGHVIGDLETVGSGSETTGGIV
jgi:hypothetical protein